MAEFQKVMHEWKRMCAATLFCEVCPLKDEKCWATFPASMVGDSKSIESIIMSWASENPEPVYPTWEEWLIDNGVFAPDNVLLNGKRRFYMEGKPVLNIPTKKIYDRIPADIAQKLGIEPKEG